MILNMEKHIDEYINHIREISEMIIKNAFFIISIVLLISIYSVYFSSDISQMLKDKPIGLQLLMGDIIGSVSVGGPLNSYILGGELLRQGIPLAVVLTFIMAWISVGIVQLPIESSYFGWKFAILRNFLAFLFAIILSYLLIISSGVGW